MKILSSHFAAICDKYDSPAPNGSFARRCEAARSSEKNSLIAKIFKYALTAALFLLATAFLIGAAAGYWIIVSRSDVPTSGICLYDSTNLLRYYLADESSDQFGKALNGDLGSASAPYDGEFHFPIVSKTPIKKFDGYDKALLPLQFADFNYGGDLTQAYFDDFGYEYVLLTGFSAGAKISPENIKTSAEILKNQSNYTWIAGVPSDAGVYAVRITSLEEVTVVGSSATRSKYGSYIVIYTIAPATATITEAAPLGGSFIVENASSAQSAATMADDSIAGGDGTFIYGVDESGKPLNQGVKVTSLTLGGSSHSVSGYSDSSVGSVKNGLNIVLSDNVKSAANHSEADNENFWYTVTASLSGAEAGNYALSNATSLRFRIAPVELNADDIKWYYDGEATNGKTVVYDGSEHGLTALIDETTVSNRYYAKYGNDESVKSAVKSLIDAINGGSAPLTLGVYTRSNDNYTAAIPSTAKVAKNAGIYLFSADVYLGGKRSTDVYLATEATNTLTINAAQLMVKYDPDPVYNGKAQQPTFTLVGLIGNDGMGVNAKVTQGATVVEPINVDSYTLTLSVSGETYLNYVFGEPTLTTETSTSHIYKIIPKPVSLTISNVSNITYDGVVHAPTATYSDVSGATVNAVTAITKDGTVINANDVKNAGAYTLTASLVDKTNYVWDDNTTADKTYNWTISKLKITVEVTNANQSATYNGAEPTINTDTTVTLTDNGASVPSFVSNELSFSVTKETGVNAGTYTLTPSAKAKSGYSVDNYDITPTNGTFTINKAALTVTANSENITYGDDKPTFSVSYSGFVNNENESVLGGSLVLECGYVRYGNVGTYSITPIGLTSGNYAITFESGRLKVSKKQITAKISLLSYSIYVTDHVLTVANPSVEFSGLVNGDTPTVTYTAVNNETTVATPLTDSTTLEKGVYTVNAVFSGDKAGNYDITVTAATLTVKENDGTVTKVAVPVANTGLVYNASNQDGITHKQANYGDYYTVSGIASAKNAGDYSVTVTLKDKTSCVWDDNTTDDKTYNWTISKLKITVKVTNANQSATYNGAEPTINTDTTVTLTDNGASVPSFVSNELSFSVTKETGVNAGTYTLTPSAKAKSGYSVDNYDITFTNGTFKINKLKITVKVTNANQSATYNGAEPTINTDTTVTLTDNGASVPSFVSNELSFSVTKETGVNAGTYTLTPSAKAKSGYSVDNYDITFTNGTFKINKLKITVKVTNANQSATYNGTEPTINTDTTVTLTDNGASAPSFVSNELSFSVTKVAGVNAGNYTLTPSAKAKSGYSVANYDITFITGTFKIDELYLKFSGIIEIDYGGSTTLSQDLLRGKLTSTNGTIPTGDAAPSFSSAVARTYDSSNDDNKAYTETKNAQGNITSISGEHGYYKVTLNNAFTVGSTYKVTAELDSGNYAFAVGGNTIIVKYKTAKIGNAYYTIEDALSESASGNITLVGDSSGNASYIITSFTMLSNYYNDSKSYTLSGRKLIVPYNANGDERNTFTDSGSFGNVYSALIIPNGVSLNLEKKETNNATLTVAAYVGFNQNISTTLAKEHGVLINNGNLIVQSGCTINAHGYIKGTGLIELKNGATAVDALSIYDWPGGTAASEFYKDAFPTNAYTIHNISCKTKIYGGAMYKAKVFVYLKKVIEIKLDEEITVIGNSDKHGMFYTNSTDEDTYVLKSVKAVNDINSNIGSRNQESGASAKNNRDLIAVFGNYFDSSVSIKVSKYGIDIALSTSTSVPLPIGYMDVTVSKGTLSLSASDYMILPGATIKVEEGANLIVGKDVDITAVPYDTISAYGGNRNYTAFSTWNNTNKTNGRFIINGTLTCESGANIGGLVECEADGATVILKNTTATYKTMYSTNKPYYASGTLSAKGYVLSAADSSIERNLASGTYYSIQLSDGTFVWYSTSANIEFDSRGGSAVSSLTRTVGNGGYTITADDVASEPTKNYYDFCGWYIDSECTTEAKGQTIFCSTTLYAKWSPTPYTIIFEARYDGCETSGSFHPGQGSFDTENGCYCMQLDYESKDYTLLDASDGDLVFLGWYTDEAFETVIQVISKYTVTDNMTLYARFLPAGTTVYTIKYDLGDSDNDNAPSGLSLPATTVLGTQTNSYKPYDYANDYNNNAEKSYYFLGWYTNAERTAPYTNWTSLTNTNENTNEFTLYAKWDKKLELQIKLTVDGTTITVPTSKYYYYGNNYTITKWSEKLTNVSTLFDTEYKHIGFSSVEDNIATVTVEKYINANVDEFTITVNSKPANPPEAIILVADVRKIIKVTLNMSATVTCEHLHYGLNNEKFKIASITFSKEEWYRDVNNSNWSYSDKLSASEITGELVFYVLSGVELTITTSNLPCNGKNWKLQNCGKTYYPTWNYDSTINNASYAHTSKTTTFKITPNGKGNIAVNWSGSEN